MFRFAQSQYTKTEEIKNSVGHLSSLAGALNIYEVLIDSNLVIKKKNLPNDAFYKQVLIKESRRKSEVRNSNSDSDYDDIVDSEY